MVFAQLIGMDSINNLLVSNETRKSKYYHLGFGTTEKRRDLGTDDEKRSYKIFEDFA
jgi:hypothetical protein